MAGRKNPLTEAQHAKIVSLYVEHCLSIQSLVERFCVNRQTICAVLKTHGVPLLYRHDFAGAGSVASGRVGRTGVRVLR